MLTRRFEAGLRQSETSMNTHWPTIFLSFLFVSFWKVMACGPFLVVFWYYLALKNKIFLSQMCPNHVFQKEQKHHLLIALQTLIQLWAFVISTTVCRPQFLFHLSSGRSARPTWRLRVDKDFVCLTCIWSKRLCLLRTWFGICYQITLVAHAFLRPTCIDLSSLPFPSWGSRILLPARSSRNAGCRLPCEHKPAP